ncbi:RNI-like protein [Xylariaceae sp. FL1651]|nr:RNI-like protein [Xylariaceae sp. FL1651]
MNNNNNNNQNRPGRSIRGPQSALTDFLASQNISAVRIRADAQARRAAATANPTSNTQDGSATEERQQNSEQEGNDGEEVATGSAATAARRVRAQKHKKQQEAIAKIKQSKAFKNKKRRHGSDSDSDELALALFKEKITPLPGQMNNCDICDKRFTVTPYSRAGPKGGLLCSTCGREQAKEEDANKKRQKKKGPAPQGMGRRRLQNRILDGTYQVGAKPLMTLCVETVAKNINLADDLGDLPPPVIDRIARLLSKIRLLDSRTLELFLQPHHEVIKVYDAAKLNSDDFIKIFQRVPQLKRLKLRNAIQFTDRVVEYFADRKITLESLYIHGANLVSEDMWQLLLARQGLDLKELQIYYTDKHFNDKVVELLGLLCLSLTRLKICHNQSVTDKGVKSIAHISTIEHLSLQLLQKTTTDAYVYVIKNAGERFRTFSIRNVPDVDDRLLDALHENCTNLTKLRITDSEFMTDAGFARLFRDWKNKPLLFLDLQKCRHVDASKPRENEHMVGLCSEGFEALMEHSGKQLRYLNVHACRNISRATFEKVFAANKIYEHLRLLEISFCEEVNDYVVGNIFRSCPNLKELNVYGCMKVRDVRVPKGKILVGVPNAIGMRTEG